MNQLGSFRVAASLLTPCVPLTVARPVAADTPNVRAGGDIQTVIDGASDGDTIQFAAGTDDITTAIEPGLPGGHQWVGSHGREVT